LNSIGTKEFIKRSKKKFGNKYGYSKTEYKNNRFGVIITCKKHGDVTINPNSHLSGCGCNKCGREINGKSHKYTTDEFVDKARSIYGDKYDYSKVVYEHSLKKVTVICPSHGAFQIRPSNHINNRQGCPDCGNESTGSKQKRTKEQFLSLVCKKNGFKNYQFSEVVDFKNKKQKVKVVCNRHGPYMKSTEDILESRYFGCKSCRIEDDRHDTEIFVRRSSEAHSGRYSYEKSKYLKSHKKVTVTCPNHGPFSAKAYIHVAGGGHCPKCNPQHSAGQVEIMSFLKSLGVKGAFMSYREVPEVTEIDVYCPERNIGVEFNGLYWHSEEFKDKNYHIDKTKAAASQGIRLIHIFEDEWNIKKEICKGMLANSFKACQERIHARKCKIAEVNPKVARIFLDENHIQGYCPSKFIYGLFMEDRLVSIMTFGANRICLGSKAKKGEYELLRFCSLKGASVPGSASRLFKHFTSCQKPTRIVSYCDMRWGTGKVYEILGFKKIKETQPNYFYTRGSTRYGRFAFRKDRLVSKGYDKSKTEKQIMSELGYLRIYDCGCHKFEWKNT
jgi:hypothetical protein